MAKCTKKELIFTEGIEVSLTEKEATEKRIKMIGYSGNPIDHYWWGRFVINVDGIKMAAPTIPLLSDHDTNRPIGLTTKTHVVKTADGLKQLVIDDGARLLDTPDAEKFISLSAQGFPFQASIYARPKTVRRFSEPQTVEINGKKFKDIDYVWDACELKEVSTCVFGYDSKTQSSSFSEEIEFTIDGESKKEVSEMAVEITSIDKLKETYPELCTALVEASVAEVTTKLSTLEDEKKSLETRLGVTVDENKKLGRDVAILKEKDMIRDTKAVFDTKLEASKVPSHLYDKVRSMVSYTKFVKDGELDMQAFVAAVDAEIADWEKLGLSTESQVQGFGATSRKVDSSDELSEDAAEEAANHLLKFVQK